MQRDKAVEGPEYGNIRWFIIVQIGTIEYEAKVSNVAEAQKNANEYSESAREMGSASEESAGSMAFLGTVLGRTAEQEEDVAQEAEQTDEQFTLLSGTTYLLTGAFSRLWTAIAGGTILTTIAGYASTAYAALSGLTLSGIIGSVTSAVSGFVSWLAAGSAGALGFAAAIGVILGLFGVWILEITGVLDYIGKLGQMLGNELPGWARDGIQAVIAVLTGPLAAIGAFIVGTIRGGFDKGFAMAKRVVQIQMGAIRRTAMRVLRFMAGGVDWVARKFSQGAAWIGRQLTGAFDAGGQALIELKKQAQTEVDEIRRFIGNIDDKARQAWSNIKKSANNLLGDLGTAIGNTIKSGFNAALPDKLNFPSITLGKGVPGPNYTIGGGSLNLPELQVGGMVEQTGAAVVHRGEAVLPSPIVNAAQGGAGGGGGTTVEVDQISIELNGDFDPSNVSRRKLDALADRLVDAIGDKTNRRSGVR